MKIHKIIAREILDSRGNPTVEADVVLENGITGRAAVPSGASTGTYEAHELRDGGARYGGKGVIQAVNNIKEEINNLLAGKDSENQEEVDRLMIEADGTENKKRLGANAILAVSLANAHATAKAQNRALFQYIEDLMQEKRPPIMPMPLCNIINGGKHAAGSTDIQEFMIVPIGFEKSHQALEAMVNVFHALKKVLTKKGYGTTVGDEGGYAPHVKQGNQEALDLIAEAVQIAGYTLGKDIALALDVASSELFENGKYNLTRENKVLSSEEMIDWYASLIDQYPIISIEDGLAEDDWDGWKKMTERLGKKVQLVGDDLFVTNTKFLERGIRENAANAILIKVNQIGTLTETIAAVEMAHRAGWRAVLSHRSGETEDATIAHLAVGLGVGQIKTGSVSRSDRTAKYNELLRIEEALGEKGVFSRFLL